MVIMTLKFDTAILTELLRCCFIKIALNKLNSLTTILIKDIASNPFHVAGQGFSDIQTNSIEKFKQYFFIIYFYKYCKMILFKNIDL